MPGLARAGRVGLAGRRGRCGRHRRDRARPVVGRGRLGPSDDIGTHIILKNEEGLFLGVEGGLTSGDPFTCNYYKIAFGGWARTTDAVSIDGRVRDDNGGIYLIGERTLHDNGCGRVVGAFFQTGLARADRNQIHQYIGVGFNVLGLFSFRPDDTFGLAVAHARNGSDFREQPGNAQTERHETAIEITYRAQMPRGVVVQPNMQYVINPSMNPNIDNANVVGVRVEFPF